MAKYAIRGGVALKGEVRLHGAKNAGYKAMIAALLGDGPSAISNLGLISEVDFARQVITKLGGQVTKTRDSHGLVVDPRRINSGRLESDQAHKSRFSILYVGPLLARFGRVELPFPGGDSIGKRPLDRHIAGLAALGARVTVNRAGYFFRAPNGLKGATFRFSKSTHGGTEVLILAAVKAKGTTILENAAQEPEIDDLIKFLTAMGAKIVRASPRVIRIEGVDRLSGAQHAVMPDRNEAVTFALAALATRGSVKVVGAEAKVLGAFLAKVGEVGAKFEEMSGGISFRWEKPLRATDVQTAPYPGFMTDWQPLWATLMTQAIGESVVFETIHERRFDYVPGLVKMGAKIELFSPDVAHPDEVYSFNLSDDRPENKHAIRISGPTKLVGAELEVGDVRSGATALLAGVAATGLTVVSDPKDQIRRGYENLSGQLVNLGAKIKTWPNS